MSDLLLDDAILAPISEAAPAGRDLTYDPAFEKLAAEVEKVTSVSGQMPDWSLVRAESARMLREDAKDLRAGTWWVASASVLEGWGAVAVGVATYQALMERFWNDMHPPLKRLRARAGLVGWLWEHLTRTLSPRNVAMADGDAVRALETGVMAIDSLLMERLGDANPAVGALRSLLREKVRSIPEAPKAAEPAVAVGDAGAGRGASGAGPVPAGIAAPAGGAVTSLEGAEAAAEEWRGPLATLARQAREAAPTAPWPYRLARISAWLTLESAPVVEDGKTFARAPRGGDRSDFQGMFDASSWEVLRDACEDALSEHPFWLDLQRWSALALERLGPPFAAARDAVGRETAALVARLPGMPSLFFSNGTPFASPETADWLAGEQARFGGGGAGGRPMSAGEEAPKALLAEAEARIAAGQVDEGLAQAIALANNAASAAIRFRAQLSAAEMAHRAGKGDLALALLERLLPQVDATLEAWEPDVCARFFETAIKVSRAVSPDWVDRQTLLFRRLLQVDPAAALRIG